MSYHSTPPSSRISALFSSFTPERQTQVYNAVLSIAEQVSIVALGVLAASKGAKLFLLFFAAGAAYGIYNYFQNRQVSTHCATRCGPVAGCTQGFLEQLTGVRLPRPVSLAANVAITVCHIDHHGAVFVPLVGVSVGAWAGQAFAELTCMDRWSLSFLNRTSAPTIPRPMYVGH